MPLQHRHGYAADLHRGLPHRRHHPAKEFPEPRHSRAGAHCNPAQIRQVRAGGSLEGRSAAGSSRTPFRLACRTRAIWQCWPVPSLSGLLPPSPASPGIRLPSASPACCDRPAAVSFHHRTVKQRLVAHDVVAPDDQPLVPRADHAHQAHADPADVGARLHDPVQDARPVRDVRGQVGVEDDFMDPAQSISPSIGSPMSCAIFERPPSAPIRYFARISYCSPLTRSRTCTVTPSASWTCESTRCRSAPRPARGRLAEDDRLEDVLRQVVVDARARERVVGQRAAGACPRCAGGRAPRRPGWCRRRCRPSAAAACPWP